MRHVSKHLDAVAAIRDGRRAKVVPYPRRVRELSVLRIEPLGSTVLRFTLGGPGIEGFESHAVDEHVRLLFPAPGQALPVPLGDDLRWPNPRPAGRDYSVRRFCSGELDIDVVLHESGLASDWARTAQPGAVICVVGPPSGLVVPDWHDAYLLAGDLSASPVIARWLEQLPAHVHGWALIEVGDLTEQVPMPTHPGFAVQWVLRGDAEPGLSDALELAVRAVPLSVATSPYVWIAGEAGAIRPLRRWARDELGLPRSAASVVGYWKRGATEVGDED